MEKGLFLVLSPFSRVHIRPAQIPAKSPTKKENVRVLFPSSGGRGGGIGPGIRGISYAHSKMAPMVSPRLRLSGELMIRNAGSRCLRLNL
jgi:hypothetical protein